ncbi:MAG: hypothetical protein K8W52_10705 [Deltaproteobacteria bacterium]|nr:hypothetical protein [Deltaproteobacteria bacterium]
MHRAFPVAFGALVLGIGAAAAAAPPAIYPLAKVKRGQTGYGLTTMKGSTPERFTFEVVDVMHNFLPDEDIILVKSDDPKLAVTGFWQGMSGSPLYIDDKVACAFSYGFSFNKVALGGCTPIEYMTRDGIDKHRRGGTTGGVGTPPTTIVPTAASMDEWRRLTPSGSLDEAWRALGPERGDWLSAVPMPPKPSKPTNDQMMTASVPLALGGFTGPAFAKVEQMFGDYGLAPMRAGGAGTAVPGTGPKEFTMGGSIAVELIRGDMSAAATGTVSYIDGSRVLAFGHRLFQVGELYAPVSTTNVHTVVPSAQSAFVLASPAREAGALIQDQQTTIAADTMLRTPMIPMDISIVTTSGVGASAHTEKGEFHVQLLDNKFLTGALAGAAAMSAVSHYLPDRDHITARIESMVKIKGAEPLRFVDYLYANDGAGSVVGGARALRALIPLLFNPFAPVVVERIEMKVDMRFAADFGEIKEVRLPAAPLPPGKRAFVDVVLATYDGKDVVDHVPVDVPLALAGGIVQLEVSAGDGARLDAAPPVDLPSLLSAFGKLLPGNVYAVSLYASDEGVALDGKIVRDLPASALDKLHPASTTQRVASYRPVARTLSPAARVVDGSVTVLVRIADAK